MNIIVNGKLHSLHDPFISAKDRGLLLGDGLFETMRADNAIIQHYEKHFLRLQRSAEYFSIPLLFSQTAIHDMIVTLLQSNALKNASIRLTLTRGIGPRGLLPPSDPRSMLFITADKLLPSPSTSRAILIEHLRRNEYSPTSQHKTLSYIDNMLAAQYAKNNGANFAILQNTKGHLACAHCANIFVDIDSQLYTPKISDGALPGIIRGEIIKNENVICKSLPISLLKKAERILISNSLIGKIEIKLIDTAPFIP